MSFWRFRLLCHGKEKVIIRDKWNKSIFSKMENIVFLLTVLLCTGVLMLFSGVLGSSALLLFLSVVSLDCCFCCCLSCRALPELSGSAVHVATELSTTCTVTVPVLLEVLSKASLLLALLLVF